MSCISFNLIYVVVCSGCLKEYTGETEVGIMKLRNMARVYRKNIKLKCLDVLNPTNAYLWALAQGNKQHKSKIENVLWRGNIRDIFWYLKTSR